MKGVLLVALLCLTGCAGGAQELSEAVAPRVSQAGETVVLLHGMVRTSRSMKKMARVLRAEGYRVINHNYPSTSAEIDVLAEGVYEALAPQIKDATTVHFVTHSLGGIVLRQMVEQHDFPTLGRVVMLAPPSQGSEVVDKLGGFKLFHAMNGPAGDQLGTDGYPLQLEAPEFTLGIIAGDRTMNPILSLLIPGSDDGKVAVSRVKPEVYADYIQLHVTHTFMMWNRQVIAQTKHFLKYGRFDHPGAPAASTNSPPAADEGRDRQREGV